jgi:protein-S-isoprenylcysteine O-methyltransferase Ste14
MRAGSWRTWSRRRSASVGKEYKRYRARAGMLIPFRRKWS